MLSFLPRPTPRRSVLTSVLLAVALVAGPLAFAPAQAAGVSISGTVTDDIGTPLEDVAVFGWDRNDADQTYYSLDVVAFTDSDGIYRATLPPGTYKLHFQAGEFYRAEYFDDQQTFRNATPIVVGDADQTLAGVQLETLPTIAGSVKTDAGSVVPWSYVVAFDLDGSYVASADTEPDGTFVMPVDPGTYRLGFFDEDDTFVEEYWQDSTTFRGARDITVDASGTTGIDARVALRPPPVRGSVLNYSAPRADGWAAVGHMVDVSDGVWQGGVSISRQWFRGGQPIPGATGPQYKVTAADVGSVLSAQVTATPTDSRQSSTTMTTRVSGVVRWTSKISVTATRGRKKATLKVRVTSAGGAPSGWVTVTVRGRIVATGKVTNGRAKVTIKKLTKTKKRYSVVYASNGNFHGSRRDVSARAK